MFVCVGGVVRVCMYACIRSSKYVMLHPELCCVSVVGS